MYLGELVLEPFSFHVACQFLRKHVTKIQFVPSEIPKCSDSSRPITNSVLYLSLFNISF